MSFSGVVILMKVASSNVAGLGDEEKTELFATSGKLQSGLESLAILEIS